MARKASKKRKAAHPLHLLIDTCVWLDLAKDYRQITLLGALEELVGTGEVVLIVPETVKDEFARNKARIAEESGRSLSGVLKRVKEAVDQFGTPEAKVTTLAQLNDIDHRIVTLGESVNASLRRIEALLGAAVTLPMTDSIKLRAAQRAIDKRAPFHRQRNGMDDAVILETFADAADGGARGAKFAFVTHNVKDFSDPSGDHREPHPDIAPLFTGERAYVISLAEVLNERAPDLLEEYKFEVEWLEEPRRFSEIIDAISELTDKVWYNRHWNRRVAIEEGRIKIVEKEKFPVKDHANRPIQRDIWEGALKSAKRVEDRYGLENLGPWDDFEWGMINGKLSALRWVLGDAWDMLDT